MSCICLSRRPVHRRLPCPPSLHRLASVLVVVGVDDTIFLSAVCFVLKCDSFDMNERNERMKSHSCI